MKYFQEISRSLQKPLDKVQQMLYNKDTRKGDHPEKRKRERKMKNMTNRELTEKIKDLKVELEKEIAENGNSKRASFLQATINLYIKKLYK